MVGDNIKKRREQLDLMQQELADRLHVSKATISSWEVGRTEPNMGMVQKLAEELNCTMTYLIDGGIVIESAPKLTEDEQEMLDAYRKAKQIQRLKAYVELLGGKS
ncbi:MAG: helix-turn-helix transcriptional regulator [Pseudobutyrivibrio sp.]|nr:helix-turn-helix transcriptional regulator [Pseudobutyrivibrio sp.]